MQGSHVDIHSSSMRLPMSSLSNRSSVCFENEMSSSNTYSIKLPYLGAILLGKSPLNLTSFQKHLRELYIPFSQEKMHDERRMIITDSDVLMFEPDASGRGKRTFIYSNFQSIVDIQILKFATMMINEEMRAAFLPIGCEHQERFRSVYSNISPSQYNLLSSSNLPHSPLLLFIIRKPGVGDSCSLLDCHVFATHRELTAFELCDMIRRLIVKQTMSPIPPSKRRTLLCTHETNLLSNVKLNDVVHRPPPPSINPFSSSSSINDTSKVLVDISRMSSPSKQRHFIKASKFVQNESDEIVDDLMTLVATEQLKTQASIKRHASFEQLLHPDEYAMNKKRHFQNKKRLLNPIPTTIDHPSKIPPRIEGQLVRPEIVINRYGDIGNYVPKFLRENVTMRSSDSNENIFFRSSNGQLINGFLKLDILSNSTPCLNSDDDHRVPNGIKVQSQPLASKRMTDIELPIDYRQYLRHTDQGAYLYGEGKRQQATLEHSLGYFP